METTQFDASLGGTEQLPFSANSFKFAASRSVEIAAMTESILRPSNTKLIFQCLPVHMRRRVMSHNSKRLPRKLREGHIEQMRKSGLPPKQKRPSRKYRRRPANLLDEYNRRKKRIAWLETHIWHAKRFHMIERWGYKLAKAPCDKAFRACYRATSAHCLIQDISYYSPVQIQGTLENIKQLFSPLTSPSCGLGICAKAYTNGQREGSIHLYSKNSFPNGYIGKVNFIWVQNDSPNELLWLFVHPAIVAQVESTLADVLCKQTNSLTSDISEKRRKLTSTLSENVQIKVLTGTFNRFRLTGPNSHSVLTACMKFVKSTEDIQSNEWVSLLNNSTQLHLKEKHQYWENISKCVSPSQLPSNLVIGLVVRDPRLSRPPKRTKAQPENGSTININSLVNIPQYTATSPLWDTDIHETIKSNKMTNGEFIEHITKTHLVPGEIFLEDPKVQSVPVVLIQRPGSQDPVYKKLGFGSGWDVIVPSGYGLALWQTLVMFGGRSGGLRETESLSFEMGECYFPPDSNSGKEEEKRVEAELRDRYFRLPPSKRVNYTKLGANSPFFCPWSILLKDWSGNTNDDDFFVLRDRQLLETLQSCVLRKQNIPQIEKADKCLVAVYIKIQGKGSLKRHAMLCLPQKGDIGNIKTLFEQHHSDPNEKLRRVKKSQHTKDLKKWRRKRIQMKKKGAVMSTNKKPKRSKQEPSEYVKAMRDLWLPSVVQSVRHSGSREVLGYLSQGAFTFTEAKSSGIGYMPYEALSNLLKSGLNEVLVRNTSSRKYRIASIHIIKNM